MKASDIPAKWIANRHAAMAIFQPQRQSRDGGSKTYDEWLTYLSIYYIMMAGEYNGACRPHSPKNH